MILRSSLIRHGESCVLEHCVKSDNVKCKSRKGCKQDALCVLSPYSDGVRGNEDMHSFCRANSGGTEQVEDPLERKKFDEARGPRQPSNVDLIKMSKDLKYEDETR